MHSWSRANTNILPYCFEHKYNSSMWILVFGIFNISFFTTVDWYYITWYPTLLITHALMDIWDIPTFYKLQILLS